MHGQIEAEQRTGWSQKNMEAEPERYVGYRGYSMFVAAADDFAHFRRFGQLNSAVILHQQDKIARVEDELERLELDVREPHGQTDNTRTFQNGSFRNDPTTTHAKPANGDYRPGLGKTSVQLLDEAQGLLALYYEYIHKYMLVQKLPESTESEWNNLRNWHKHHNGNAIARAECEYIEKRDLCRILPRPEDPVRDFLILIWESLKSLPFCKAAQEEPRLPYHVAEDKVRLTNERPVNETAKALNLVKNLALLLGPIWTLASLESVNYRLAASSAFVVVFAASVTYTVKSSPTKALGLTATYCTILMVFYSATKAREGASRATRQLALCANTDAGLGVSEHLTETANII